MEKANFIFLLSSFLNPAPRSGLSEFKVIVLNLINANILSECIIVVLAEAQSTYKYRVYYGVCPFVGIWTLPPPLSPASVPLPPNQGGGAHSLRARGVKESQFRRL